MTTKHRLPPWLPKALVGVAALGVLVAILLMLAGTFREKIAAGPTPERGQFQPGPGLVEWTTKLTQESVIERFPGTVEAVRDAIVSPRITAQVLAVECRAGDRVAEGDTLVRLDARDLALRDSQAGDALTAAEAGALDAKTALRRLKTIGESGAGAISQREIEVAEARVLTSSAELAAAQSRVEEAQVSLGFALLKAPFSGVVADRFVEAGDTATLGTPIVRLYDPSKMRLEAPVRESLAIHLTSGSEVRVELAALGRTVVGEVEQVVPLAEPGSRSLLVKVSLASEGRLYPGLFGRLLLPSGERQLLRVPEAAVTSLGQLSFVTLSDGRRRMVTVGTSSIKGVEIRSGLKPGESILVLGD